MKKLKLLSGIIIASIILASCSTSDKVVSNNLIQKRKYNKGFYLSTKGNVKKTETLDKTNFASAEKSLTATYPEVAEVAAVEFNQQIESTVVSNSSVAVENISSAKVANTSNEISEIAVSEQLAQRLENLDSKEIAKIEKKAAKVEKAVASKSMGGDNQIIALVLCLLVGGLGIHRFYLGYIGIGVAQLLTAGGCGIWALIDLVRIITGDLKPNGGRYSKTL
jgi:TM2 domain-containing membrane protein YozV